MNAVGASPVHIDSKRWKAPRLPGSCLPSRGRRNAGGLKPLSVRNDREGGWCGDNVNADTGNRLRFTEFGRALQLRIRNRADDDEVLGERKRKGPRNAIGTQTCFGSCAALIPATRKRRFQVRHPRPSARLSDPCAPSRPIRKKWVSGLRAGRGHVVRLLALAGASSRRGETPRWQNHRGREDGPLSGRERALYAVAEVVRPCVVQDVVPLSRWADDGT
jgi:hypothetical protein